MNKCSDCGREREKPASPRLPRRWKRREQSVYCPDCWRKQYVLRAISVPVASPLDGCYWRTLDVKLQAMWAATTACSNWMVTQLYARDVRRQPGDHKKPRTPQVYLYPEARQLFPQLPSQTVSALEHSVSARYRARRYEVVWTAAAALPTFRYPVPFPLPNQAWNVTIESPADKKRWL